MRNGARDKGLKKKRGEEKECVLVQLAADKVMWLGKADLRMHEGVPLA